MSFYIIFFILFPFLVFAKNSGLSETFGVEIIFNTSRPASSEEEQSVYERTRKEVHSFVIPTYSSLNGSPEAAEDQVLLVPDHHGVPEAIQLFWQILKTKKIEWLGLEMFPSSLQGAVDSFLKFPLESVEFKQAQLTLFNHSGLGWANYWGGNLKLENDPYMTTLLIAKELGIRVIALEHQEYRNSVQPMFRIDSLGIAVRNNHWVQQMPKNGRGLVFGGALHFLSSNNVNVQNYLFDRGQKDLVAYDFGFNRTVKNSKSTNIDIIVRTSASGISCRTFYQ